jgi:DNA polymerase III delta prime subunit
MALAVFICRVWAAPNTWGRKFPLDRRAMACLTPDLRRPEQACLDLSEGRIRGAISTLEKIAFLDRQEIAKPYQKTFPTIAKPKGGVKRRPILWKIAADFEGPLGWNAGERKPRGNLPTSRVISNTTFQKKSPYSEAAKKEISLLLGKHGDGERATRLYAERNAERENWNSPKSRINDAAQMAADKRLRDARRAEREREAAWEAIHAPRAG